MEERPNTVEKVVLGPNDMDGDDLYCTNCNGKNLVVFGRLFQSFMQTVVDGKVTTDSRDGPDNELEEEVTEFFCSNCKTHFMFVSGFAKDLMDGGDELAHLLNGKD